MGAARELRRADVMELRLPCGPVWPGVAWSGVVGGLWCAEPPSRAVDWCDGGVRSSWLGEGLGGVLAVAGIWVAGTQPGFTGIAHAGLTG